MQLQIDIEFDQLVSLAKKLPLKQWTELKTKVEQIERTPQVSEIERLLLNAPTFTKKQIDAIEAARKSITQWRED